MNNVDIDHIDPVWKENRDRQLVCGLSNSVNLLERDRYENIKKSNGFLPWRTAPDEIGCVPTEVGDLCQFLDPESNEWVLQEFLSDWWFEKTSRNRGGGPRMALELEQRIDAEIIRSLVENGPHLDIPRISKMFDVSQPTISRRRAVCAGPVSSIKLPPGDYSRLSKQDQEQIEDEIRDSIQTKGKNWGLKTLCLKHNITQAIGKKLARKVRIALVNLTSGPQSSKGEFTIG